MYVHICITSHTCGFLHSTPSFKNPLYQALALIARCLDYKGSTRFPLCSEGMRGLREERGAGMRGSSACAPTGGGSRGPTGEGGSASRVPPWLRFTVLSLTPTSCEVQPQRQGHLPLLPPAFWRKKRESGARAWSCRHSASTLEMRETHQGSEVDRKPVSGD